MVEDLILDETNRAKLDGIVNDMVSNGEADADIKFVVSDFKNKYGVKKKDVTTPLAGNGLPNGLPLVSTSQSSSTGIDIPNIVKQSVTPKVNPQNNPLQGIGKPFDYTQLNNKNYLKIPTGQSDAQTKQALQADKIGEQLTDYLTNSKQDLTDFNPIDFKKALNEKNGTYNRPHLVGAEMAKYKDDEDAFNKVGAVLQRNLDLSKSEIDNKYGDNAFEDYQKQKSDFNTEVQSKLPLIDKIDAELEALQKAKPKSVVEFQANKQRYEQLQQDRASIAEPLTATQQKLADFEKLPEFQKLNYLQTAQQNLSKKQQGLLDQHPEVKKIFESNEKTQEWIDNLIKGQRELSKNGLINKTTGYNPGGIGLTLLGDAVSKVAEFSHKLASIPEIVEKALGVENSVVLTPFDFVTGLISDATGVASDKAKNLVPSNMELPVSQKYKLVDGNKIFLDKNNKPTFVRDADGFKLDPKQEQLALENYNTNPNKEKIKIEDRVDIPVLFNEAAKFGMDIVGMGQIGKGLGALGLAGSGSKTWANGTLTLMGYGLNDAYESAKQSAPNLTDQQASQYALGSQAAIGATFALLGGAKMQYITGEGGENLFSKIKNTLSKEKTFKLTNADIQAIDKGASTYEVAFTKTKKALGEALLQGGEMGIIMPTLSSTANKITNSLVGYNALDDNLNIDKESFKNSALPAMLVGAVTGFTSTGRSEIKNEAWANINKSESTVNTTMDFLDKSVEQGLYTPEQADKIKERIKYTQENLKPLNDVVKDADKKVLSNLFDSKFQLQQKAEQFTDSGAKKAYTDQIRQIDNDIAQVIKGKDDFQSNITTGIKDGIGEFTNEYMKEHGLVKDETTIQTPTEEIKVEQNPVIEEPKDLAVEVPAADLDEQQVNEIFDNNIAKPTEEEINPYELKIRKKTVDENQITPNEFVEQRGIEDVGEGLQRQLENNQGVQQNNGIGQDGGEEVPTEKVEEGVNDIDKLEAEYNDKSVDELVALKKQLYPNPDIESAMSAEEKLLNKVIAKKYSDINAEIALKRKQSPISKTETTEKPALNLPENAWGSEKSINDNFYTKDENGFAVKIPLNKVKNVNIDGVDFHVSNVDGDWKVIEKNSGLEVSTGKTLNTNKSAIEDAIYRVNNNGGASNIPKLSERAIKQFTDSNASKLQKTTAQNSENNVNLAEDKAENELANAKLTEQDNVEQEPSIKDIEGKAESNNEAELNEVVKKSDELINGATGVEMLNVSDIKTDEASFQNRTDGLNEDKVNSIVENYNPSEFDPIVYWTDADGNKITLNHHRFEASKRLNLKEIPARQLTYPKGHEKAGQIVPPTDKNEAIDFAINRSNANRSMETPVDRAKALREMVNKGASKEEINKFLEREGKNKGYVENLSNLNPKGKTIETLNSVQDSGNKVTQKETEKIADWIGDARKSINGLTDAHENEMFDFLMDEDTSKRITTKADFLQKVRSVVNPLLSEEPLNLQRFKNKTQGEQSYDEEVSAKKTEIADRQKQIDAINDRFSNPANPDYIKTTSSDYAQARKIADEKISKLDAERKALQKQLEDIYRNKGKYVSAPSTGDLFGGDLVADALDRIADKIGSKKNLTEEERTSIYKDIYDVAKGLIQSGKATLDNIYERISEELSKRFPKLDESEIANMAKKVTTNIKAETNIVFTGKEAENVLIEKGYDKKKLNQLSAIGKIAFYKRELLGFTPDMFTENEFHQLYMVHGTNFGGNGRGGKLVSEEDLLNGMNSGWVASTQKLSETSHKFEGNYTPGTTIVLVPKYYVKDMNGAPKVQDGFKPQEEEIHVVSESEYTPFKMSENGHPQPYGLDYKKIFSTIDEDNKLSGKVLIADSLDRIASKIGSKKNLTEQERTSLVKDVTDLAKGLIQIGKATIDNVIDKIKEELKKRHPELEDKVVNDLADNIEQKVIFDEAVKWYKDKGLTYEQAKERLDKIDADYTEQELKDAWNGESKENNKRLQNRAFDGTEDKELKDIIESYGLTYDTESQIIAESEANDIIKQVGLDKAFQAVQNGYIKGAQAAFIYSKMVDDVETKLQNGDLSLSEQTKLKEIQGFLIDLFDTEAREAGRFISMLNRVYDKSLFKYDNMVKSAQKAKGGELTEEEKLTIKEQSEKIAGLEVKMKELEVKLDEERANNAVQNIKAQVNKANKPVSFKVRAKGLADKVRKLKTKSLVLKDADGNPIELTQNSIISYNDIIELAAKSIEKTGELIDGINTALNEIKKQGWYQNLSQRNKDAVDKQVKADLLDLDEDVSDDKFKIPHSLIREIVKNGIEDINGIVKKVMEVYSDVYPDLTERKVRDIITKYGEQKTDKRDDIDKKIAEAKRIGRLLTAKEVLLGGKIPERSGLMRDKPTPQERLLNQEIQQLLKNIPKSQEEISALWATALDKAKTRAKNRIEELQLAIDKEERIKKTKNVQNYNDAELDKLKADLKDKQAEYNDKFPKEKTELSDEQRINQLINSKKKRLEVLKEQKVSKIFERTKKEGIDKSKFPELNNQIADIEAEIKNITEEIKQDESWVKHIERKRIELAKKSNIRRIEELQRRIKENDFIVKKNPTPVDEELKKIRKEKQKIADDYEHAKHKFELANRSTNQKIFDGIFEGLSLSKQLVATADLSAPLRQGATVMLSNPMVFGKAFMDMHKQAISHDFYDKSIDRIKESENYDLSQDSGLSITDMDSIDDRKREEQYVGKIMDSDFAKNTPILKQLRGLNKGSERAYSGFLNNIRFNLFEQGANELKQAGYKFEDNPKMFKALASTINNLTGRGLSPTGNTGKFLNFIMFSPKMITSRFLLLHDLARTDIPLGAPSRKMAAKSLLGTITWIAMFNILGTMAKNALYDDKKKKGLLNGLNINPIATDFLKVRDKQTTADPTAGYAPLVRTLARVVAEKSINSNGKEKELSNGYNSTRFTPIMDFMRNKLSPIASYGLSVATHKNPANGFESSDKASVSDYITPLFVPLQAMQIVQNWNDKDPFVKDLTEFTLGLYGIGVQQYDNSKNKKKGK